MANYAPTPKDRVDQVPVQVQAPAITPDDFQALGLAIAGDGQRDTRFEHREDAHQAFSDPVLLGDGPGHRFLRLTAGVRVRGFEIAVGTPRLFGGSLGVLYQGFCFALKNFLASLSSNPRLYR